MGFIPQAMQQSHAMCLSGIGLDVKRKAGIEQADAMMRFQIKTLVVALFSCKSAAFA